MQDFRAWSAWLLLSAASMATLEASMVAYVFPASTSDAAGFLLFCLYCLTLFGLFGAPLAVFWILLERRGWPGKQPPVSA